MNKKHLSVVMAGAMLATTVAPVLAETTKVEEHDVLTGNMGLLYKDAEALFASKVFSKNDAKAGQTVYSFRARGVEENGTKEEKWWYGSTNGNKTENNYFRGTPEQVSAEFLKSLKDINTEIEAGRKASYEIELVELGNRTNKLDEVVSTEGTKYIRDRFIEINNNYGLDNNSPISLLKKAGVIEDMKLDTKVAGKETLTLTLANNDGTTRKEIVLTTDDFELDFNKPVDKDGKELSIANIGKDKSIKPSEVVGFKEDTTKVNPISTENNKVLYKVNLLPGSERVVMQLDDLYDGLMLTEKGHALLRELNEARANGNTVAASVKEPNKADGSLNEATVTVKKGTKTLKVVTIKGTNTTRLNVLVKWLEAGKAQVDILAGDNRYATAVEIAKTFVAGQYTPNEVKPNGATLKNIVMINGTALVDGLAAAPYAKVLNAPILLTAEGKLPQETKDYLRELVANNKVAELPTIHIIGGEAVVSEAVVSEMEDLGFKVRRVSGDDREETSLAVADKVNSITKNKEEAFVVGSQGEADAMSIASYAAASKTPIIVSKTSKGLSTVGLNEVADFDKATIVGGDGVVPQATEDKLVKLMDKTKVSRISGKDRQDTNAKVIAKYHKDYENVLVAKDGMGNKSHLVDALPVSVFASAKATISKGQTNAAPIVLATKSLTKDQVNQVYLNTTKFTGGKSETNTLYQVGNGVERFVMETLASRLGLLH